MTEMNYPHPRVYDYRLSEDEIKKFTDIVVSIHKTTTDIDSSDQTIKQTNGKDKLEYVPMYAATHGIAKVREWAIDIQKKYPDPKSLYVVAKETPMKLIEATIRHMIAVIDGGTIESIDDESGLPHIYLAQTNLAFLATSMGDKK